LRVYLLALSLNEMKLSISADCDMIIIIWKIFSGRANCQGCMLIRMWWLA